MTRTNLFFVLGVPPRATPGEIERGGRKLLALLEVGGEVVQTYTTPYGDFPRDATMVREALAKLRDPRVRAKEALLAEVALREAPINPEHEVLFDDPCPTAFADAGWKGA